MAIKLRGILPGGRVIINMKSKKINFLKFANNDIV
jgi:hypothetical protein